MANELIVNYPTGSTLYALLFDATGQVWNGAAFAAPGSANWTDYDIAMSEVATATGVYRGTMPAAAAGVYSFVVRKQAGGAPAVADIAVGVGHVEWDGAAEVTLTSRSTLGGTAQTGDAYAQTNDATNGLVAIKGYVDDIGVAGAGLTALGDTRLALLNALALNRTTIATLASQTSFTLTAGSPDNIAYANCICVIEDASTAAQKAIGIIGAYTGATRTVTLRSDPGVFTMALGDTVTILPFTAADVVAVAGTAQTGADLSGVPAAALVAANLDHLVGTATGIPTLPTGTFLDLRTLASASYALEVTLTKIKRWLQLLFRSDTAIATDNATELGEINASGGSGVGDFANTTEAVEALRDRGDTAWITATGFAPTGEPAAALEAIHLDHLLAVDYDPASKPGVATALLNEIIGSDAGVSQLTANALELAPTGGTALTAQQARDAMKLAPTASDPATGSVDKHLDDMLAVMPTAGAGSENVPVTITVGGLPEEGVAVWVTTEESGANVVAGTVFTDSLGYVLLHLDPGPYWRWLTKAGHNFTNPVAFTVTDEP